jgi:hypothetical protein
VIRNAVLHISNEQPLIADLYGLPSASDVGLLCTNLRSTDGRKPVFIDHSKSTFFFPYLHIRFLEIPAGAIQLDDAADVPSDALVSVAAAVVAGQAPEEEDGDIDLDEDFLKRVRDI